MTLILKRASASRPSGEWNDDDYDVLADGAVVGRIMKAAAVPVGMSWMWALAGVPTGGHSGFDVLDIDPDGLDWLRANQHRLPETRAHLTRRRGLHLFFHAWPNLRCSVGRIAPGVDVR